MANATRWPCWRCAKTDSTEKPVEFVSRCWTHGRKNIFLRCDRHWKAGSFIRDKLANVTERWKWCPNKITDTDPTPPASLPTWGRRNGGNAPKIGRLLAMLCQLCGDKGPTAIPGISDYTLLQVVAETGAELAANWKTEKRFTA